MKYAGADADISVEDAAVTSLSSYRFAKQGLTFDLHADKMVAGFRKYQRVFSTQSLDDFRAAFSISVGLNLGDGIKIPAIARAYLEFAAQLATDLNARSVAANHATLLTDCSYFVESVEAYRNQGPFPALAVIAFDRIDDGRSIQTRGLGAFSSQELLFDGGGLEEVDIMHRMIRLVHDICVNGPVLHPEHVRDLDGDGTIILEPVENGRMVKASIQYGLINDSF